MQPNFDLNRSQTSVPGIQLISNSVRSSIFLLINAHGTMQKHR